jgi:serine protease Do
MRNEVIAINTAIFSRSGGYMGIGFAIPINMARQVMDVLLKDGKVVRGFLGATMQSVTPAVVKEYGLKTDAGVLIRMVDKGGPAEKGGLKAGDVVTRFNGKTITDVADLRNKIAWTKPGTKVKLGLVRKGKKLDSVVTLGKRLAAVADKGAEPARPEGPAKPSRSAVFEKLGITARDMTAREARRLGHRLGEGVLITRVKAGSPAQKVGLVPGHLILKIGGKATRSVAELKTALADMDPKKGLRMLVKMGRSQVFIYMRGG